MAANETAAVISNALDWLMSHYIAFRPSPWKVSHCNVEFCQNSLTTCYLMVECITHTVLVKLCRNMPHKH